LLAVVANCRCDAMRREHADLAGRDLVLGLDEDRAHPLQPLDDVVVVDDLVPDVDRRAVTLEQALDDLDRAVDAGAERARSGEQHASRHASTARWRRRSARSELATARAVVAGSRAKPRASPTRSASPLGFAPSA